MTQAVVPGRDPWVIASLLIYFAVLLGIAFVGLRRSGDTVEDYFLGGRRMKNFVVALSAVVSGRSAWLIVGVSGMAYARGLSAVWAVPGYILAELWMFFFLGKRLRRYTALGRDITLPDFFESRFRDTTHLLRIASAVILVIFMIAYIGAQFAAGGKALSASFDIGPTTALWLTAIVVLSYTLIGGFFAVSWTDVFQAVLMLLALVILPAKAIIDYGGFAKLVNDLGGLDAALLDPWAAGLAGVIGFLAIGLGSPGNPHILVRYMSVDHASQLRRSALVGTLWNVLMAWGAIYAGLLGRALFPNQGSLPAADTENLFPFLASLHLHPFLFGLVIAAILMAIMSTADSQLLVLTSSITRDLYQKVLRGTGAESEHDLVRLSRVSVLAAVAAAAGLAIVAQDLIFWLVLFAWAGLGAALGPAVILSLYWARTTREGVLSGFVVGTAVVFAWRLIPALKALVYELVPGFLAATIAIVVVSLLTSAPEAAAEELRQVAPRYRRWRARPETISSSYS